MTSTSRRTAATSGGNRRRTTPDRPTPRVRQSPVAGRLFDARPDRLDFRDLPYQPPLRSLPPCWPLQADLVRFLESYVAEGLVLDQGTEGACTGFGLACVANYLLWAQHLALGSRTAFRSVSPRMFYELARRYDEWPGEDYEGSSCRGALKGWNKHGVCGEAFWPYGTNGFVRPDPGWAADATRRPLGVYYRIDRASVVDLQAAIANIGAIYVSANVHAGWDRLQHARTLPPPKKHADLPVIEQPADLGKLGGHAFALVGYDDRGFIVQNSWGTRWGRSGFAVLAYDDWVAHGTDAWACALGVPMALTQPPAGEGASRGRGLIASSGFRVASGRSLTGLARVTHVLENPADDPWPFDHKFDEHAYDPLRTAAAYGHTLVTGNDGKLVPTDFTRDPLDLPGLAQEIVRDKPLAWLATQADTTRLRLAIYAHGGLNDQASSVERIRVLAPYFLANGIYPLFLTWKTGVGETLGDMAQDWLARLFGTTERAAGFWDGVKDAKDRAVEALAHVLGKGLWTEMRENAAGGLEPGHGLDLLAKGLQALRAELDTQGAALELHLVGHSAGSILLGHLLSRLAVKPAGATAQPVASCTLFAPACSVNFAVQHYLGAAAAGVLDLATLHLYVLSDENEKRDGLPTPAVAAYGKSLLYLVSRALDDVRKQPLLGLARAHDPRYANDPDQWDDGTLAEVQAWQAKWPLPASDLLHVVTDPQVIDTKEGHRIQATHGSFDNNIDVMETLLRRIVGRDLIGRIEWLDY